MNAPLPKHVTHFSGDHESRMTLLEKVENVIVHAADEEGADSIELGDLRDCFASIRTILTDLHNNPPQRRDTLDDAADRAWSAQR
jgi:hypothetical protein